MLEDLFDAGTQSSKVLNIVFIGLSERQYSPGENNT